MQWRKNSYSRPRNVVTRITKWYELSTKQNLHSCACYCSIQDTWSEVLFALEPLSRRLRIFILHVFFSFLLFIRLTIFPTLSRLLSFALTKGEHSKLSHTFVLFPSGNSIFVTRPLLCCQNILTKTSKRKVLNRVFSFNSAVNRSWQYRQARSSSVSLHIVAWSLGSPGHHCFLNVPSQVKDNSGCWPWACYHSLQVSGRNRHR